MLTTKKQGGPFGAAFLLATLALAFSGCTPPGPRALLEGERLMKEDRYGDAVEPLRKACALLPENALARNHLGVAYHYSGQPREAYDSYTEALKLRPDFAVAKFNRSCLLLEMNRPAEAAIQFASFVIMEPRNLEARLYLGAAQLRANRPDEAEKTFREILAQQRSPEALNGLGIAQVQRKRVAEAVKTFAEACQVKADYPPALLNLAVTHAYLKSKPMAWQLYRSYLSLNPRPLFYEQALAAFRQVDAELNQLRLPSASNAAPAVTNQPAPPVLTNLVREPLRTNLPGATATRTPGTPGRTNPPAPLVVLTNRPPPPPPALSNPPPAVAVRHDAPVTNPAPVVVPPNPAPKPVEPVAQGPRYRYLNPPKPAAGDRARAQGLFLAGQQAVKDNRLPDAVLNFEAATKVDPAYYEAFASLARAQMDAGDVVKALAANEMALAINPEGAAARFNLGLALDKAGYPADAAEQWERYYQQNPKESNGRLFLATLYIQKLKQPEKARVHYQALLALEPQHAQAPAIREWLHRNP